MEQKQPDEGRKHTHSKKKKKAGHWDRFVLS